MTDISKEAVELHIQRCWLTDPEPDRTETLLRALSARVEELESEAEKYKIRWIDAEKGAYQQGIDDAILAIQESGSRNDVYSKSRADAVKAIEALKEQSND